MDLRDRGALTIARHLEPLTPAMHMFFDSLQKEFPKDVIPGDPLIG